MVDLIPAALLAATQAPAAAADTPLVPAEVVVVEVPASRTLPDAIRTLIQTAIEERDEAALAAIVKMARKAFPDNRGGISAETAVHDAAAEARRRQDEQDRLARLANPDPFANWTGEIELGASRATGSTDNLALYAAGKAEREGLKWSHGVNLRADLQRTGGERTTERIIAGWQPRYRFEDVLYAYGLGQFEHDRFLGIASRETIGGGIGYTAIDRARLKLNLEGGPALRRTDVRAAATQTTIAARASVKLRWTLNPNLQVSQDAAMFVERDNNNASASTALETRLLGALKARISYNLQYEEGATLDRGQFDTLSRATLVYAF